MPDSRTTKKSGAAPRLGRKVPATKASASHKGAAPNKAAVGSRASRMLKDIRARGEELTSDINDLLRRLS